MIYLFIVLVKIIEVSIMTLRTVLMTKGEKLYAASLGAVEVSIWLYLMSTILSNIQDDPWRIVAYAVGFSAGIYLGSVLEEKIGVGLVTIHVISDIREGREIASLLRSNNIAVTNLKGEGRDAGKSILVIYIKRRSKREAIKLIKSSCRDAFISVYDVKNVAGGYGLKK